MKLNWFTPVEIIDKYDNPLVFKLKKIVDDSLHTFYTSHRMLVLNIIESYYTKHKENKLNSLLEYYYNYIETVKYLPGKSMYIDFKNELNTIKFLKNIELNFKNTKKTLSLDNNVIYDYKTTINKPQKKNSVKIDFKINIVDMKKKIALFYTFDEFSLEDVAKVYVLKQFSEDFKGFHFYIFDIINSNLMIFSK